MSTHLSRCVGTAAALLLAMTMFPVQAGASIASTAPRWVVREQPDLSHFGSPSVLVTSDGTTAVVVEAVHGASRDVVRVRAFAAATGALRWGGVFVSATSVIHRSGWAKITPAGRIIAIAEDRNEAGVRGVVAVAVDPNGDLAWRRTLEEGHRVNAGALSLSPDGSVAYVGLTEGRPEHVTVQAVGTDDGVVRWSGRYDGHDERPDLMRDGDGALAATDTTVFAAVCGRCDRQVTDIGWATVVAFDAATGGVLWDATIGKGGGVSSYADQRIATTPDGATVVAAGWAAEHPAAAALAATDGHFLWRKTFPFYGTLQAVAVDPTGTVAAFAGDANARSLFAVAIDVGTGDVVWRDRHEWRLGPWIPDVAMSPDARSFYVAAPVCGGPPPAGADEGQPCRIDLGLFRFSMRTGDRSLAGRYGAPREDLWPHDMAIGPAGGRVFEAGHWSETGRSRQRPITALFALP